MSSTGSSKSVDIRPGVKTETTPVANEYEDAERNFQPKSLKFWVIILGVYLSIFLIALDRTIIATAIPSITDDFDSIADIGWYGSAYMLTAACFNPIFGRIYQLYSTKYVFLGSIIIFEAGSALCGAAPSSVAFILGRAIAGGGSAGVFSGGTMIMLPLVPVRKRPVFTSLFGLAFGVSSVLGPIIGGTFTDEVTWRWCFYLNLPCGGFIIAAILIFFHVDSPKREKLSVVGQIKRLDPAGALFFVSSMVCLILALQWGGSTDPWSAPKIIGLLVTFAVLFVIFVTIEVLNPDTAMAPTRVILNRSVASAMLFMFLLAGSMMAVVYYLSIWFQAAKGESAMQAGIHTIPLILTQVIIGIMAAIFTQKVGYYVPAMLVAPVLCSTGAGLLSTLSPSSTTGQWVGYQILYAIGIGCGFQTSTLVAQVVLPRADVPIGMAIMFLMQQLGGSIALAIGQSIFSNSLVKSLSGVVGLDPEGIVNTGATDLSKIVPAGELSTVVQAYSHALTRVFILATALSACLILGALAVEWKNIKKTNPSESASKVEEGAGEEKS